MNNQISDRKSISVKTFNVTYDPNDKVYYIVCPECGEYVYYKHSRADEAMCNCGYFWKVKNVAIGKKAE